MSHCVPDWDGNGGELDAVLPSTDFSLPVKGKWESLPHKRSHLSDLAFVPTHDAIEPEWTDEGHIVAMQGQGGKGNKAMWPQLNFQNTWPTGQETEDAVTPAKPLSSSSPGKDPVLVVNEPQVDPHHAHTLNLQEDEMVSWLQYPLDDSLERNYCSDFFGELPNSNISDMQLMKDSFGGQNQAGGRISRNPGPMNIGSNSINSRVSSADAAMAMGAGRAAGLLPQTGVEAFTKVRTTMQPYGGKWCPSSNQSNRGKTLGAAPSSQAASPSRSPPMTGNMSTPMLPPKSQGHSFQPPRTSGPMNFSHFSRPAAVMKASLHSLGMSHGVAPPLSGTNVRLKTQPYSGKPLVDPSTSSGSSMAESTTTRQRSGAYREENDAQVEGSEAQRSLGTESSWPSMQNSLSGKDADAVNSSVDGVDCDSKPVTAEAENCRNSSATGSPVLATEKHQSQAEVQEAPEPTITSSSGGSGNSAERGKEAAYSGKRRTREGEESECQSEVSNLLQPQVSQVGAVAHRDGEDEAQLKKPQQRGSTTKRSRAAEVHNLSERRRRDRINEKMKALQELIPNSNKTDKASMLDEAIEYLKMLQLQLQMMSMRSGMSIPSMVMPGGMQHLQMPQLPPMGPMPPIGMGMGMGMGMGPMGMGMSMMDMGGGAPGRPMLPHPSHSGGPSLTHNVSATSPAVSMVDNHDQRLQNPTVMDSLNVYLAQQHRQMQMAAQQPMAIDAFSAYMMQHHQHHQQQQHQQQQHQQQQHQHQHQHQQHQLQHQHPHSSS